MNYRDKALKILYGDRPIPEALCAGDRELIQRIIAVLTAESVAGYKEGYEHGVRDMKEANLE